MAKKRQLLIDTTVILLKENPNVSLEAIIRRSGVSKSTLHRQFQSKEELIGHAFNQMGKTYFEGLTNIIFSSSDAEERLFKVYQYDLETYRDMKAMQWLYDDLRNNGAFELSVMQNIHQAHQLVFEAVLNKGKCHSNIDSATFWAYYRSHLDFYIRVNQNHINLSMEKAWDIFWNGISNTQEIHG